MPQCAPETEVRCIELFLQCYALLSQGGGEEALCEAMYYDLFDYAEEDVRERFTERNKGGYSLSLTLPGEYRALSEYARRGHGFFAATAALAP